MVFDGSRLTENYDPADITIATVCSHSSLQIFHGARQEGFRTLGISVGPPPRYYEAYPLGAPDEFLQLSSWGELMTRAPELVEKNVVLVPHGSFVEYLGGDRFAELEVPVFGNRRVLEWESDRSMERKWLEKAGVTLPREIRDPKDIDGPVIVKYHGAKGGKGFFVARTPEEFEKRIDRGRPFTIQEFVLGTRYYLHYFYSPIQQQGYKLSKGCLQMMSVDRRDETNIDEANRLGSVGELEKIGITPTFVVTGNFPLVIRESLLRQVFTMGEGVVESAKELFGGMPGPFCLETVVTDELEFKVFEISARIVAGTNPFIGGSPYADLIEPGMSTGRRIARELKDAGAQKLLHEVTS